MALKDIHLDDFPLRFEDYSGMHDQLTKAEGRFRKHGYAELADDMVSIRAQLSRTWDKIVEAERNGD